jgi:ATP-dependent protease ClpP protease subunit
VRVVSRASAGFPITASRVLLGGAAAAERDNVVSRVVAGEGRGVRSTGQRAPHSQADGWYSIKAISADEADVLIYDEISWDGISADSFQRELGSVQARQLNVHINSPGGSVFDGIAIANALYSHPATVNVYVDGLAASIASVIAMSGDRVVMMPRSQMMIHDASGICLGNAADMAEMAALLDKQSDNIANAYADRAGGTAEEWRARMREETWYTAEEAVEAGLADEVAPSRRQREDERQPEMSQREQLIRAAFRYAGREQAPEPVTVLKAQVDPAATGGVITPGLVAGVGEQGCEHAPPAVVEMTIQGEHGPELIDLVPHLAGPFEPVAEPDPWASLTAHLTQPAPDPWAGLVAHLTSSSAATSTHA